LPASQKTTIRTSDEEIAKSVILCDAQWDLVCDRAWLVDLVSTVYMTGRLVACLVIGPVSDRYA